MGHETGVCDRPEKGGEGGENKSKRADLGEPGKCATVNGGKTAAKATREVGGGERRSGHPSRTKKEGGGGK